MANSPGKGLGLGTGPGAARTANAPRRVRMRIERTFIALSRRKLLERRVLREVSGKTRRSQ